MVSRYSSIVHASGGVHSSYVGHSYSSWISQRSLNSGSCGVCLKTVAFSYSLQYHTVVSNTCTCAHCMQSNGWFATHEPEDYESVGGHAVVSKVHGVYLRLSILIMVHSSDNWICPSWLTRLYSFMQGLMPKVEYVNYMVQGSGNLICLSLPNWLQLVHALYTHVYCTLSTQLVVYNYTIYSPPCNHASIHFAHSTHMELYR